MQRTTINEVPKKRRTWYLDLSVVTVPRDNKIISISVVRSQTRNEFEMSDLIIAYIGGRRRDWMVAPCVPKDGNLYCCLTLDIVHRDFIMHGTKKQLLNVWIDVRWDDDLVYTKYVVSDRIINCDGSRELLSYKQCRPSSFSRIFWIANWARIAQIILKS